MTDSNNLSNLSLTEQAVLTLIARAGEDGISKEKLFERIEQALERLQQKGIVNLGVEGNQTVSSLLSFAFTSEYPSLLLLRNNSSVYSSVKAQSKILDSNSNDKSSLSEARLSKPSLHIPTEWVRPSAPESPESLVSSDLMSWVLIWNSSGIGYKVNPNKNTKILQHTLTTIRRLRRGSLFNRDSSFGSEAQHKFSIEDFETAISGLILAAKDSSYEPTNKHFFDSLTLPKFLYSPYSKTPMFRSLFLHYLLNPPKKIITLPEEKDPLVTKNLIRLYGGEILGEPKWKPPRIEMVKFIEGANFVVDFFERNKGKIFNGHRKVSSLDKAVYMWEALKDDAYDKWQINPGWFNSERTLIRRLPKYLNKSGILNGTSKGPTVGDRIEDTDCQIPSVLQ